MKPIAIFYHCLFFNWKTKQLFPAAVDVIRGQMRELEDSGLLAEASHFQIGVNGGAESQIFVENYLPRKAKVSMHGMDCQNENLTIVEMERWLRDRPDWYVFYFHARGASHEKGDWISDTWRRCMMKHNVQNWRRCVHDLDEGYDAVGCHWMEPPATPEGQYIFAGTFWWANSNYLRTLPSIMERDRIKESGLTAYESRYEAEVWLGMATTKPKVKDYHGPDWNPGKLATCNV